MTKLTLPPISPSKHVVDHPFVNGPFAQWVWRLYSQRLTTAGRWFLFATAIITGYTGISLRLQGYQVFSYVFGLWCIALVALWLFRPRMRLRAIHADRVRVGEVLPVDLEVEPLGRFTPSLVLLAHRLPKEIDSVPEELPVPLTLRGQSIRLRLGLRCWRRGAYRLHGYRAESDFPFGLMRARRVIEHPERLLVYPSFTPLARLSLPVGRAYQPGGVVLASFIGESAEYIGNREYREGDEIRHIDWRATARSERPVVREYRDEYFMRVAVILDTHLSKDAKPPLEENFERAVSVAASVSDYMARQDYLVDIFAAGPNLYHLTAGRSLAYLDQILDILACVESTSEEPFAVVEPEIMAHLARITTVVLILMDWDEPRRQFARRLSQHGSALKIVIVRDGRCTEDPADAADLLGPVPVISRSDFESGIEEL